MAVSEHDLELVTGLAMPTVLGFGQEMAADP
jgi:hypothetical protein